MKIQNNFLKATVNKDLDERLTPNGQMVDSENFMVKSEDDSNAGVGKNVLGNTQKTNLGIVGGETIGSKADGSRDRIFYLVAGDLFDYLIVWNLNSNTSEILLQSTAGVGVLNLSKDHRVSHIDIFESDEDSYLISWNDGLNPPRIVNIDRAAEYGIDGFTEEEISVIKAPPRVDIQATPTQSSNNQDSNFIEDKFLCFAYRYKFKDGFFSAISSWTAPQFVPSGFSINAQTGFNEGMLNSANAVDLVFNTGSREVVEVDLLFKETNSSVVYVIDKFNKEDEGWSNDSSQSFQFNNSKIYLPLPQSQYFRNFDNVPLVARTQAKIGNRLVYGNYEEGRDVNTVIDFEVDIVSEKLNEEEFTTEIIDSELDSNINNKVDWDTREVLEGSSNDFMDLETNVFNMTMVNGSNLIFNLNVDLTSTNCVYKIIFTDIELGDIESSQLSLDGSLSYTKTNSTGSDLPVEFKAYVVNQDGEVLYNTEMTIEYNSGGSDDFKNKYIGNYKQSYKNTSGAILSGNIMPNGAFSIEFNNFDFEQGSFIFIDYQAKSNLFENASVINGSMFYELESDYSDLSDFYNNSGFRDYIEITYSNLFENEYTTGGVVESFTPFGCDLNSQAIVITTPVTKYIGEYSDIELYKLNNIVASSSSGGAFTSLHSNRDYEVSMIYMDKQGRKTTALTCKDNTIYIPNSKSNSQNKLKVTLNHTPPSWADRYKFAVKQVKGNYETIFANTFYRDGAFAWFKVVGSNKLDLKEGDELIVKRDTAGIVSNRLVTTTILEVKNQERDFIEGNVDSYGQEIREDSGTYIKIFPDDFRVEYGNDDFLNTKNAAKTKEDRPFGYVGVGEIIIDDENNSAVPSNIPYTVNVGFSVAYRAKILSGLSYFDPTDSTIKHTEIPVGSTVNLKLFSRRDDDTSTFEKLYIAENNYTNFEEFFNTQIQPEIPLQPQSGGGEYDDVELVKGFVYYYQDESNVYPDQVRSFIESDDGYYFLKAQGIIAGRSRDAAYIDMFLDIRFGNSLLCFETKPMENIESPFYETPETYNITANQHEITEHILTDTFNCFAFGNGVESHQIQDKFNEKYVSLNAIPTAVSEDDYKRIDRYADLTYSGVFQPNTNVNSLNEFNLSQANFKDDIEKRYGKIVKLYPNETDLLVIQEDKWSKVLYGKDLLFNSDTTTNLSRISEVLGQQVMYGGEYGISTHPESFDEYSFNNFCTDVNRGVVMRKNNANGLSEISNYGMTDYFKKLFRDNDIVNIIGAYDAFYDVYFLNIKYNTDQYVTWVFSDSDKGFLTRATFNPEDMVRLNNEFISFKNGDVYLHNNGEYNTFYGVQSPSKFSFNFSQEPSTRKLFRNISIEGTDSWNIDLKTDLQEGFINKVDFKKKEGVWYGYVRGEEGEVDLATLSVQGIGQISEVVGNTISFTTDVPSIISVGDVVYNTSMLEIGNITNKTSNSITLNSVVGLSVSDFVLSTKPQSIETSGLLGYYMRVDAELTSDKYSEVFAVNSEVSKSFE